MRNQRSEQTFSWWRRQQQQQQQQQGQESDDSSFLSSMPSLSTGKEEKEGTVTSTRASTTTRNSRRKVLKWQQAASRHRSIKVIHLITFLVLSCCWSVSRNKTNNLNKFILENKRIQGVVASSSSSTSLSSGSSPCTPSTFEDATIVDSPGDRSDNKSSQVKLSTSAATATVAADPPPCTYSQLKYAFGHRLQANKKPYEQKDDSGDCWQFKDELLQLPVTSIWNRNLMTPLGSGKNGSVYKGIVQLKTAAVMTKIETGSHKNEQRQEEKKTSSLSSSSSSSSFCSVAIKTERCCRVNNARSSQYKWRNYMNMMIPRRIQSWLSNDECDSSCIITSPTYPFRRTWKRGRDKENHLRNEYTGALLHAASQKTGQDLPGMLPTWGVLVPNDKDDYSIKGEENDPFLVGVIMPLQPLSFVTVSDLLPIMAPKSAITVATKRPQQQEDHKNNNKNQSSLDENKTNHKSRLSAIQFAETATTFAKEEMAKIMLPAATALQFAHHLGIAQQDLGTRNIAIVPKKRRDHSNDGGASRDGDTDGNGHNHVEHINNCRQQESVLLALLQGKKNNNYDETNSDESFFLSSSCFHAILYDFTFASFVGNNEECTPVQFGSDLNEAKDNENEINDKKAAAPDATTACQFCRNDNDFSSSIRQPYLLNQYSIIPWTPPHQPNWTIQQTETKRFIYHVLIPFWNALRIMFTGSSTSVTTARSIGGSGSGDGGGEGIGGIISSTSKDEAYYYLSTLFAKNSGLDQCDNMDQVVNLLQQTSMMQYAEG